jgi:hypothetical protein
MIVLVIKLTIYKNMRTYIYIKGIHAIQVLELDDKAKIQGLSGWIDAIELMALLLENGYRFIK